VDGAVRSRRRRRVAAALVGALALVVLSALPASATAYRYWSYWHGTAGGTWTFSPVGASFEPKPGAVDGWRFAVSQAAGSVQPRVAASFAVICGGHAPASAGRELVGLVVDYGTSQDAPPGQHPPRGIDTYCADMPIEATSAQILTQYATVRTDSGLVCGIDGYPAAPECGVVVGSPGPTPTAHPTASPHPSGPATRPPSQPATHAAGVTSRSATPGTSAGTPSAAGVTPTPQASPSGGSGGASTGDPAGPTAVAVGPGGVAAPPTSRGPSAAAVAGALLVLALGVAAVVRARAGRS
jgi:hypothetical protein